MTTSSTADIEFFFDPVCPFAWITSRWVEKVVAQSDYDVEWRFISLRILNKAKDYPTEFPPGYEHGHTAGLRMLRVAAHVRDELGPEPLGPLYTAFGDSYFSVDQANGEAARAALGSVEAVTACLTTAGLDTKYAATVDDTAWDKLLDDETEIALSRTGRDVGTPIITFQPPDGLSFFGPVISRVPADEDALPLWEAVTTLARYPGFAEMKRSMREAPQLNVLGGMTLFAIALAFTVEPRLGASPWTIFHEGASDRTGLSFGTVVSLTGVLLLAALWWLKEPVGS